MRSALAVVALGTLAVAAAYAQTGGGPPIAYVKIAGNSAEIYLVNPDGTGLKKVYGTASKRTIGSVDLKPGGAEIAFTEFGVGSPRVVKILSLNGSTPAGQARTLIGPCGVDTVDYHPTDPVLIISDICNASPRIATIRTDGSGYSVLQSTGAYLNKARWLKDGISYVYVRAPIDGGPLQLCKNSCDAGNGELLQTVGGMWSMDVGRTANILLHDSGGPYISKVDADAGAVISTNFINGTDGHFSADDRYILYETPHEARGDYLHIYDNTTGLTRRLTTKGDYGPKDWRQ
jgi:Tol biopolymer transport system component